MAKKLLIIMTAEMMRLMFLRVEDLFVGQNDQDFDEGNGQSKEELAAIDSRRRGTNVDILA